jgi:hypothetical protein
MNRFVLMLAVVSAPLLPGVAAAEAPFRIVPSMTTSAVHDGNLFLTASDRQADIITRVSPAVDAEYRAALWELEGRYTFDIERYGDHAELSSADARRQATAALAYRPSRRLTINVAGEYSKVQGPGELNTLSGLAFARARTERIGARGAVSRELSRVGVATIDYQFTNDRVAGGTTTRTHTAGVGVARRISPADTLTTTARAQQFSFEGPSATAVALGLRWTRIMRSAELALESGPRVTNGAIAPDVSAQIRFPRRSGSLTFAYFRTQSTVVGLAGTSDLQGATATAAWTGRRLHVTLSPSVMQSDQPGFRAVVYQLSAEAARKIAPGVLVVLSASGALQHLDLQHRLHPEDIQQPQVALRIVVDPRLARR